MSAENDEILAAILTAGMLPTVPACADPEEISTEDVKRILGTVGHAISLYAAVLESLRSGHPLTDHLMR
jgi:hypothetical protein